MTYIQKFLHNWNGDRLLKAVIRRSVYLFSSSTISMVLMSLVGFLTALMLGPESYGALGVIIIFASSVNRLLSFRMGELVVKYGGEYLAKGRRDQASAVIRAAAITEAATSVVAYLVLLATAPLAAQWILKEPEATPWITFYGLTILANLMTETSTAVLQLGRHYRTQAALGLLQSVLTALGIALVFGTSRGLYEVLTVYLIGKLAAGLGTLCAAVYFMPPLLGKDWLNAPADSISNKRELVNFAISTNLSGTANMIIRDSELLWVGFFLTKLEAGYYKFALAVMNIILMPITPFISTTFPEIAQSVTKKNWKGLRPLLRRTSLIALVWTGACLVGLLVLGQWVLGWVKQGEYLPSYPAILVLLVGYGLSNIFFWNRPLLLAFGEANYPLKVNVLVGVVKTALMFVLVRPFGFLAQAGLLSGYLMVSVGLQAWKGLWHIQKEENSASGKKVP